MHISAIHVIRVLFCFDEYYHKPKQIMFAYPRPSVSCCHTCGKEEEDGGGVF
jgi:hypothetical protein